MDGLRVDRRDDGVALVTLDRPDRLNALDDALLTGGLLHTFESLDADADVRAIVLTGEGRGFCAGADFESQGFAQPSPTEAEQYVRRTHRAPAALRAMDTPSVAAVNGPAAGAGLGLALACDLRLAGTAAMFSAPFTTMGLVPDFGVTYFLPRVVGTAWALDLLLTGRSIGAEEAERIGLVSRVCANVVAEALEVGATVAAQPPHAVTMTRRNTYRSLELDLDSEVLEQEPRAQAIALQGSEFPDRFAAWRDRVQG